MSKYGCFDRKPITTFGQPRCQYQLTQLGKKDKKCLGCKEKKVEKNETK